MSWRSISAAWNRFFFAPQSPTPIALFRILYGLLVLTSVLLAAPDWLNWYGAHPWVSLATIHKVEQGSRIDLFELLPQTDGAATFVFWLAVVSSLFLTAGLFTRISSIVVFICLSSIQQRNLFLLHSGDAFLRIAGFFLMFAPAGAALSVDRLIRIAKGKERAEVEPKAPWVQRIIQIQMALVYFTTFWWKSMGATWVNGTAVHYMLRLEQVRRFPVPSWLESLPVVRFTTWAAMFIEFALGVLVWIKELRYAVLLLGVVFHLAVEYTVNAPLFEWTLLSTYVLFIDPADLKRVWTRAGNKFGPVLGESVHVVFDRKSAKAARKAELLKALDVFGKLRLHEDKSQGDESDDNKSPVAPSKIPEAIGVETPEGPVYGFDAILRLSKAIPLLWPLRICFLFRHAGSHEAKAA